MSAPKTMTEVVDDTLSQTEDRLASYREELKEAEEAFMSTLERFGRETEKLIKSVETEF